MNTQNEFSLDQKQEFQVTCPFCSVGCRYKIRKGMDEVIFSQRTRDVIDFDYENPINEGALCPRGHFSYELMSHPRRLSRSYYRTNGKLTPEISEIIFQKLISEIKGKSSKTPLTILINPLISLHDIRALLDFATNNKIDSIDFVAPIDRSLFRAMLNNPYSYRKCDDPRVLKNLNYILSVGDVFTKHPVLSRHVLQAKYLFRQNALFNINPVPSRTSWFANIYFENALYTEPLYLGYLFKKIYEKKKKEFPQEEFKILEDLIHEKFDRLIEEWITPENQRYLDYIVKFLASDSKSAILYSTHPYNVLGSYISGMICTALSSLTSSYLIPLYADGNFNAIEDLARDVYPHLNLGRKPMLHHTIEHPAHYAWAVGWNPVTYIPGSLKYSEKMNWIISSLVQDEFPPNSAALLAEAHFNEQMDLRTNFISWQSIGSQPVKSPIGSAQSIAHYTYLFHQKASEQKIELNSNRTSTPHSDWDKMLPAEMDYYLNKLKELNEIKGIWVIPTEHMTHYKDASLTQYSSWAKRDCMDEELLVPANVAQSESIKNQTDISLQINKRDIPFRVKISQKLVDNIVVGHAHYSPLRQALPGEFAPHNHEYYFWCPKIPSNLK
jgi:predicted molibdopterin-dependent oxidoreductase YjgC